MPELKITYRLDMQALTKNNDRKLLKALIREELTKYETTEKVWGKENHNA